MNLHIFLHKLGLLYNFSHNIIEKFNNFKENALVTLGSSWQAAIWCLWQSQQRGNQTSGQWNTPHSTGYFTKTTQYVAGWYIHFASTVSSKMTRLIFSMKINQLTLCHYVNLLCFYFLVKYLCFFKLARNSTSICQYVHTEVPPQPKTRLVCLLSKTEKN